MHLRALTYSLRGPNEAAHQHCKALPPLCKSSTRLVQAKKAAKADQPQAGPTAEERAAAIAALRARQQQKRRASQAADADTGTALNSAAQQEVADLEDGSGHGREPSTAAIAPEWYEPSRAVCYWHAHPSAFCWACRPGGRCASTLHRQCTADRAAPSFAVMQ